MKTITKYVWVFGLTLAGGCGLVDGGSDRIDVTEKNDLGVASLQTERISDHGNDVFTLRAFAVDEHELASVRLTTGTIPDLSEVTGWQDNVGSEIVVTVPDANKRTLTHETEHFQLAVSQPQIARFLALEAVSSVLERDASIFILPSPRGHGDERSYTTASCAHADLNVTPTAEQCCATQAGGYDRVQFLIHAYTKQGGAVVNQVVKTRNPNYGSACRAADGTSSCSGAACYYGPNGFDRPQADPNPAGWAVVTNGTSCSFAAASPSFFDVTGDFTTGAGCCGNSTGLCGVSGYPACAACGGNSGAGSWDY